MVRRRRAGRDRINPGHAGVRKVLIGIGLALALAGIVVIMQGREISANAPAFFADSDAHMKASERSMARYAIGGFLLMAAVGLIGFAIQGTLSRYTAAEHAPVVKDTVGYVVDGTRGSVKSVAQAVAEGVRGEPQAVLRCHKCNKDNDPDAKFCSGCGAALAKSVKCAACGELNDPDANFCDACGKTIT